MIMWPKWDIYEKYVTKFQLLKIDVRHLEVGKM